jgi:hypothetical protein
MKKDGAGHVALPLAARRYTHFCWLQKLLAAGQIGGLGGELFLASRLPTAAAEENGCRYRRGTYTTKLSCGLNHLHCVGRDAQGLVLKVPSRSPLSFLVTSLAFSKTEFRHVSSPGLGESFAGKGKRCRFVTKKWPALAINTRFPLIMD